jgi:hypothetical protein
MIDKYFIRPVLWDYFFAIFISIIVTVLCKRSILTIPSEEHLYSIVSDLCTIALTMTGFILTLLTVLISFKSTLKIKQQDNLESNNLYELFFSTNLYFETVRHLKNAIKSLTVIAVVGYIFKLSLNCENYPVLYIYNVFGIVIIFLTLWRCLIILSKIIKLQQEN